MGFFDSIKFPFLKKPVVPNKMYEVFEEIDREGLVFFIGTYNDKDREFFYSLADDVFEYLGKFLLSNNGNLSIGFDRSGVDIRLIKASIQINHMRSLLTSDESLKQKCLICVTYLYTDTDKNTIEMNNKWFTDWNNRLIAGLEKLKEWEKKQS